MSNNKPIEQIYKELTNTGKVQVAKENKKEHINFEKKNSK